MTDTARHPPINRTFYRVEVKNTTIKPPQNNKPFNEVWKYPSEEQKKIIGAKYYKIYTTEHQFSSGRDKLECIFYNSKNEEIKKYVCMGLTSKLGNDYQLIKIS